MRQFLLLTSLLLLFGGRQPDQNHLALQNGPPDQWVYQGIYVDHYPEMAGDVNKETDFLRWCQKYGFNVLTIYGIHQVLSSPRLSRALADFIHRAKTGYGIKQVSAVVTKAATVTGPIDAYDNDRANRQNRFDYTNLELEWWNNAADFGQYDSELEQMKNWGMKQSPAVPNEEYIGWFKNPAGEDSVMAASLVQHSSRILLHDYQQNFTFSYIQPRLEWIGKAARAQGKIMPVIIIFNAKPEFSAAYFSTHPFADAYQWVADAWHTADFPGKSNIQLIGFQLYNQSFARQCKP
jgi:hypothetical protein